MKREMSYEDLDALWHEMVQDKDAFGHPGGCPFADAFFQRAKSCTADCWRKAGPEIVYDMLRWVWRPGIEQLKDLDCSCLSAYEWQELLRDNPSVLAHPQFDEDNVHPLDILHAVNTEMKCLEHVDDKRLVARLLPEHEAECAWSVKDIEQARAMRKPDFAEWVGRVVKSDTVNS